jgi:hypothetical protein
MAHTRAGLKAGASEFRPWYEQLAALRQQSIETQAQTLPERLRCDGSETLIDNDSCRSDPCEIVVPHGAHNPPA